MLAIIDKRKYSYFFSGTLIMLSLLALFVWGLNLGIDFKGGTLMEVKITETAQPEASIPPADGQDPTATPAPEATPPAEFKLPTRDEITEKFKDLNLSSLNVQESEGGVFVLRYLGSDEATNEKVLEKLKEFNGTVEQLRVDFVGSSVSKQFKRDAIIGIIMAVLGVALYIAWAFRKVSYPVASWQYGLGAIIALAHDITITLGAFAILGKFMGVEVGVPFVAALLTILGYSVNDTIVGYDRIRENIIRANTKTPFEEVVNKSINETIARSINTSMTVIIVLVAIILFGGDSIKYFSIALLIGVGFGTYSSIFIASALLVSNHHRELRKK
ncbi:MAG: protein translocase subunit SecF [Candidatus Moraniibacteriota bacterium]